MSSRLEGMPFSIGVAAIGDLAGVRKVLLRASVSRVVRDIVEGLTPLMHVRAHPGGEVTRPRIVTTLAGAGDLVVAEEGLAAGYDLWAILSRPSHELVGAIEDPLLRARLERALGRAGEVSEPTPMLAMEGLDGTPATQMLGGPPDAHSRLLMSSDLVVCIWDGEPDSTAGSPGAMAVAAAEQGIPVVWIDAAPPHGIRLYSLSEPHPESWNRILPPDVLERLEKISSPAVEDHPSRP